MLNTRILKIYETNELNVRSSNDKDTARETSSISTNNGCENIYVLQDTSNATNIASNENSNTIAGIETKSTLASKTLPNTSNSNTTNVAIANDTKSKSNVCIESKQRMQV